MFRGFSQLFSKSNKDLRKRIYITLACLGIFCLGTTITIPWASVVYDDLGFLEIFNLMSGGGLKSFSIFGLGVSPYITASIITQLLQMDIIPYFKDLKDQGYVGRQKINKITRYLGIIIGFVVALLLYQFKFVAKIVDPFLTMLNSLPKVALGPLIIIISGANGKSIIIMALLINLIVSIITIYNGFISTDEYKIKLLKSMGANKLQILTKLVIPQSYETIITSFKLNISLTLIGVIMGEFLVSKQGIGYLIVYGKQVFNLDLVMTGIFILIIISYLLYKIIIVLEKKLLKYN